MQPGGAPPNGPIQDRIQRDAQTDASWANMNATPGGVQNILAANANANQAITSAGVIGAIRPLSSPNTISAGAGGGANTFGGASPNTISAGAGGGANNFSGTSANPFNQPLTFAPNTAGFFVRAAGTIHPGGGLPPQPPAGFNVAPGGGVPNWGAGLPGQRPPGGVVPPGGGGGGGGGGTPPGGGGGFGPPGGGGFGPPGGGGGGNMPPGGGGSGNAIMPPGGGGGGGGGGRGGGLPGAIGGWVGLRNTGNALGGGAFSMGIGAEIAKELFFLPQTIAGMEGSWLGKTAQARDYIGATSIMGQSGGFNSRDFRTNLRNAAERGGDDWLLRSGLGADEAAQMVGSLGVVPRSTEQATSMARNLAHTRTTPGMSGIPTGALTSVLRDMLGVGATTPDRMGGMNNDLGAIMKQTAQTGQDQLKVLRSIDTGVVSLSTAPGAATAVGPDTLFQANQRFLSTPAGRMGIAGEQSISSTQSAFSSVGSNPARTIVASTMVEKLKTEDDLKKFFGNDAWDTFTASPVGRELADTYLRDIKAGNKYGAMQTLSQGLMQDPTLAASGNSQNAFIDNPITKQFGSGQAGLTLATQAHMSNMSEAQVIAFNQSRRKGLALGMAANNPLNLADVGQPGVIGSHTAADGEKVAVFPNMAAGVAASVNQLRRYERGGLMSPRELALKWSGGHASDAYIKSVADSMGVGVNDKVDMNDPDMARRYIKGAQPFESGPTRMSSADINSGVDLAFGRRSANPNLNEGEEDPNVPGYNAAVGTAKSDVLHSGSERTLRQGQNLNERVNEISDTWRAIVFAVEGLATAVRTAATVQTSPSGGTLH